MVFLLFLCLKQNRSGAEASRLLKQNDIERRTESFCAYLYARFQLEIS